MPLSSHFAPGRRTPLLLSLVALFALYPIMVEFDKVRFLRFAFLLVLMLSVYSIGGSRRHLVLAALLAAPAAFGQLVAYGAPGGAAPLVAVLLGLVFLTYTTFQVFVSVFRPGRVTADKIAGAISVYLLVGLVFALACGLVAMVDPGAYRSPGDLPLGIGGQDTAGEYTFIYYSFTTLTTLGYGDIAPASHWSQTLAWAEAVIGQLFLAILVARLVGLHIVHSPGPPSARDGQLEEKSI